MLRLRLRVVECVECCVVGGGKGRYDAGDGNLASHVLLLLLVVVVVFIATKAHRCSI